MRLLILEDRVNPAPLLPDLFALGTDHLDNWTVNTSGGTSTLRYETAMANWGQGPFELRATGQFRTNADGSTSQLINQRIFNSDGSTTDVPAGWWAYNPSDGYIHYDDMAHANLRIRNGTTVGDIVATGAKTSYCLIDIDHSNPGLPGSPATRQYTTCGSVRQGISVGWNDVYGSGLNGQSINVTGIPNGDYWLEVVADPLGAIQESNESNNATRIAIHLGTMPNVGFQLRSSTPTGNVDSSVSYVDVSFNQLVNPATFDTSDATLTGPGGASVAITSIEQINTVTFRIHFDNQSAPGGYTLRVGPHISSATGAEMDQNNNGIAGEAGDVYTSTFVVRTPAVESVVPSGTVAAPVSTIRVNYNKAMQSSTFTIADLSSFTGPGGANLLGQIASITPVTAGGLSTSFNINLTPSLTALGAYSLVIEPTVLDAGGNPVDQNGDGVSNSLDRYTANFVISPPGTVGPDSFGYDAVTTTTQSLELVGQSGTTPISFTPNSDDGAGVINLGTNKFNFYGTTYTGNNQLYVSTNGLVTFGAPNTAYQNDDMSNLAQPAIAVLWSDWIVGSGSPQALYKFFDDNTDGTMDRLVIEWNQIYHYSTSPSGATFMVVLQLNTGNTPGDVFLNYPDLNTGDSHANGATSTIGLHRPAGGGGNAYNLLISRNGSNSTITNNVAVRVSVPRVVSMTRQDPNPIGAPDDAEYEVTFNHPVTGVTASAFFVTTTGSLTGSEVHYILPTADPAVWEVYVKSGYGTGTLRLGLNDDDAIVTPLGARLGGLGAGNGAFNNSEVYDVVQRPPTVQGFNLDDGTAQRSTIRQIVVTFDMLVSFVGNPSDAFQLTGPGGTVSVTVDTSGSPPGQTVAKLTFSGVGTEFGSVADGNYTLRVLASNVIAGGVSMTSDSVLNFYRFFGDINGDRRIDIADYGALGAAYNSVIGDANYRPYLDFNNDGRIDIADYGQFGLRYLRNLP